MAKIRPGRLESYIFTLLTHNFKAESHWSNIWATCCHYILQLKDQCSMKWTNEWRNVCGDEDREKMEPPWGKHHYMHQRKERVGDVNWINKISHTMEAVIHHSKTKVDQAQILQKPKKLCGDTQFPCGMMQSKEDAEVCQLREKSL